MILFRLALPDAFALKKPVLRSPSRSQSILDRCFIITSSRATSSANCFINLFSYADGPLCSERPRSFSSCWRTNLMCFLTEPKTSLFHPRREGNVVSFWSETFDYPHLDRILGLWSNHTAHAFVTCFHVRLDIGLHNRLKWIGPWMNFMWLDVRLDPSDLLCGKIH